MTISLFFLYGSGFDAGHGPASPWRLQLRWTIVLIIAWFPLHWNHFALINTLGIFLDSFENTCNNILIYIANKNSNSQILLLIFTKTPLFSSKSFLLRFIFITSSRSPIFAVVWGAPLAEAIKTCQSPWWKAHKGWFICSHNSRMTG